MLALAFFLLLTTSPIHQPFYNDSALLYKQSTVKLYIHSFTMYYTVIL